jgi:hypothetical protein
VCGVAIISVLHESETDCNRALRAYLEPFEDGFRQCIFDASPTLDAPRLPLIRSNDAAGTSWLYSL